MLAPGKHTHTPCFLPTAFLAQVPAKASALAFSCLNSAVLLLWTQKQWLHDIKHPVLCHSLHLCRRLHDYHLVQLQPVPPTSSVMAQKQRMYPQVRSCFEAVCVKEEIWTTWLASRLDCHPYLHELHSDESPGFPPESLNQRYPFLCLISRAAPLCPNPAQDFYMPMSELTYPCKRTKQMPRTRAGPATAWQMPYYPFVLPKGEGKGIKKRDLWTGKENWTSFNENNKKKKPYESTYETSI